MLSLWGRPRRLAILVVGAICLIYGAQRVSRSGGAGEETAPTRPVASESQAASLVAPVSRSGNLDDPFVPVGDDFRRTSITLERGGTLDAALKRLGLAAAERHRVVTALRPEIDLGRLPVATALSAAVDAEGRLVAMSLRAEQDRFLRVHPAGPGGMPRVETVTLPRTVRIESVAGEVEQSVRQALDSAEWADELTANFADIFQWDIDLLVEPRKGDRVSMVFRVHILGDVPADLPPFGKAAARSGQVLGPGRILAASYDGKIASSRAYWVANEDGEGNYFDERGEPMRKTFLKSPLNYRRISSGFSRARRHPITRRVVPHHGVDFAAAKGTPVVAAADGRVISAGWDGPLGRAVRLRHGSEYVTVYGHLKGFANGIRGGSEVHQNQVIGYVGSTGRATGPHLHYTLIHAGRPVDPMRFRNPPVEPLAAELRPRLARAMRVWSPMLHRDGSSLADSSPRWTPEVVGLRRGV